MNLFVLSYNPVEAAQLQCDKHVVKMIVESGQMLSTTHRMLDGRLEKRPSKSGKTQSKYWVHPDEQLEKVLYRAVHMHHPCTVWTMQTSENYKWHYDHFVALCDEFKYRYGKIHRTDEVLRDVLSFPPMKLPNGPLTKQPLAMKANPECMLGDVVESYRAFYQTKQARFKMVWTKRDKPDWFVVRG